ncbi:type VI secretion system baseplate subunit TssG [Roseateles amylovorans]|uniref:Type VI secretion system baseplate subunit TssG n=1 Tax=Roseateles amylovorans TaxID=2978473 RepID=A0ABY6B9M5_9BURK|nr:type VI secretion system baseplate subunit TssG [Roseateles amylovorans]UXH80616.1 type VI secretion system baseplate subunit TssG [Roseateles amylovorans]
MSASGAASGPGPMPPSAAATAVAPGGAGKAPGGAVGAAAASASTAAFVAASMAGTKAAQAAALQDLFARVEAAPWAHDFFALLRRVEGLTPDAPRLGRGARPSQEAIRLGEEPELDFAPAALASLTTGKGPAPRLGVRFFGLLGPQGPMPLHLTEYARERLHQRGDPTLTRFLDVFHHRLLLFFYRAWAQSQPAVQHDRPESDRYAAWLGAAVGLDGRLRPQDSLPQTARLFNAGLMGGQARHPEGLAKILSQHFGVPVRIEQHVPHWLPVEDSERTRLGHARNRRERIGATPAALGRNTSIGNKAWDRQFRFRVVLGPLSREKYEQFLPDGSAWRPLNDWIRQYVGHGLWWEIRPLLRREAVPAAALGRHVRLGYTSWAGRTGHGPQRYDRGDLRLRPDHLPRTTPAAAPQAGGAGGAQPRPSQGARP